METEIRPSIFEYENYRSFLADLYDHLKATTDFFSYRYFSKKAGYSSPNYLKLVIEGQRNISDESIEKFSSALKLSRDEANFFSRLVSFNQAKTNSEKAKAALQLMKSKIYKRMNPLKTHQMEYYSHWYFVAIRELTLCSNFKSDLAWIGAQFSPQLSKAEVEKAINTLLAMGLIQKNASGVFEATEPNVATQNEVSSSFVTLYHKQMMEKAAESLDTVRSQSREISSVCIPLSPQKFQKIKEKIQEFRKELLALAEEDNDPTGVYQMNFQLFPLTSTKGENE